MVDFGLIFLGMLVFVLRYRMFREIVEIVVGEAKHPKFKVRSAIVRKCIFQCCYISYCLMMTVTVLIYTRGGRRGEGVIWHA